MTAQLLGKMGGQAHTRRGGVKEGEIEFGTAESSCHQTFRKITIVCFFSSVQNLPPFCGPISFKTLLLV